MFTYLPIPQHRLKKIHAMAVYLTKLVELDVKLTDQKFGVDPGHPPSTPQPSPPTSPPTCTPKRQKEQREMSGVFYRTSHEGRLFGFNEVFMIISQLINKRITYLSALRSPRSRSIHPSCRGDGHLCRQTRLSDSPGQMMRPGISLPFLLRGALVICR